MRGTSLRSVPQSGAFFVALFGVNVLHLINTNGILTTKHTVKRCCRIQAPVYFLATPLLTAASATAAATAEAIRLSNALGKIYSADSSSLETSPAIA